MYKMKHEDFGAKEWIEYYDCLNDEVPVEKLRLELDDEGKKEYVESLEYLKEQRKTFPGFGYEVQYSWFEWHTGRSFALWSVICAMSCGRRR